MYKNFYKILLILICTGLMSCTSNQKIFNADHFACNHLITVNALLKQSPARNAIADSAARCSNAINNDYNGEQNMSSVLIHNVQNKVSSKSIKDRILDGKNALFWFNPESRFSKSIVHFNAPKLNMEIRIINKGCVEITV